MFRCRRFSRNLLLISLSVLFLPLISRAGERELWFFWNRQVKEADHHAEILKTCQAYAEKFPDDLFLPVVRSIEAWHLLRQGKQEEALERLEHEVLLEKQEELAREFDAVHTVERAQQVGSLETILPARAMRPHLIGLLDAACGDAPPQQP